MRKNRATEAANNQQRPQDLAAWCGYLVESCPFPLLVTEGSAHVIVFANPAFRRLCGRPARELVGLTVGESLAEWAGRVGLVPLLDRVYANGRPECALSLERPGYPSRPANWSLHVWPTSGKRRRSEGLMLLLTDRVAAHMAGTAADEVSASMREINEALVISSVQQHEIAEAARHATEAIQETGERDREAAVLAERNRIAREIHDTLAQAFTGILLQLRVAQRIAEERPEEAWELVERVGELAQEGLSEARRSVWALQPEALQYGDLAGALSQTIDRVAAGSPASIELLVNGTPRALPPDVGVDLLRIGQEALTNAVRHGQAHLIYVELTFAAESVLVRVQDDGLGFDVTHQADSGGFGLIGMSQRAERLGGQLSIASQPGRGTEVAVWVPIPPDERLQELT